MKALTWKLIKNFFCQSFFLISKALTVQLFNLLFRRHIKIKVGWQKIPPDMAEKQKEAEKTQKYTCGYKEILYKLSSWRKRSLHGIIFHHTSLTQKNQITKIKTKVLSITFYFIEYSLKKIWRWGSCHGKKIKTKVLF